MKISKEDQVYLLQPHLRPLSMGREEPKRLQAVTLTKPLFYIFNYKMRVGRVLVSSQFEIVIGRVPLKASGQAIHSNLLLEASKKDFRYYPSRKRHSSVDKTRDYLFSFTTKSFTWN